MDALRINYANMDTNDMLFAMGDDGARWAASFCQHAKRAGYNVPEDWMLGWFANAIETSGDFRRHKTAHGDAYRDEILMLGNAMRLLDELSHNMTQGSRARARLFLEKHKFHRLCR